MVFYENNTKNLEKEKFEQWLQVGLQTYIIHNLDFFLDQLQNLKYEVFYENDKKNLQLEVTTRKQLTKGNVIAL